jgi:Cu/Ag efflux pump CusA
MKGLIQWSIDHSWMVIGLALLLLGAGGWTARQLPIDVFPDLTAPTVTILTEGHGMAPEEMESLVTFPLESAINGASGVRRVRSATAVGIAVVWVEFDWGTDIFVARQLVSEKLSLVSGTLPPQVERPVLAPVSSIMGEILFFAISSDRDDPLNLRTIADTTVRRRLLAVPGVSQVTPIGGSERQFQVIASGPAGQNVSLTELLSAVRGQAVTGGRIHGGRGMVRSRRCANRRSAEGCRARGDRSVLVRTCGCARRRRVQARRGLTGGKPAVIVASQKQPGANTIEVLVGSTRLDTLRSGCRLADDRRRIFRGPTSSGGRGERVPGPS